MNSTSKREMEYAVSKAVRKIVKEQLGEDAEDVIARIVGDAVIIRLRGILPQAERHMIRDYEGLRLLQNLKVKLMARVRPFLEDTIKSITKMDVVDMYSNFSLVVGERIEIVTLDGDLEKWLLRNEVEG